MPVTWKSTKLGYWITKRLSYMEIWKNLCNLICKNCFPKEYEIVYEAPHILCSVLLLPCNAKNRKCVEFWQNAYPIWFVNIFPPKNTKLYMKHHIFFFYSVLLPCNAMKKGYSNLTNFVTSLTFKYVSWMNAELCMKYHTFPGITLLLQHWTKAEILVYWTHLSRGHINHTARFSNSVYFKK